MNNRHIEYPHPVLSSYTNDYCDSFFEIEVLEHDDNGSDISLKIRCNLKCAGLDTFLQQGSIAAILRVICERALFRKAYNLSVGNDTIIKIPKSLIKDEFSLHAMLVATTAINNFHLDEFNNDYFGTSYFSLRKGDILAEAPLVRLHLNTVVQPEPTGIVYVRLDKNATIPSVHFASREDEDPTKTDYIYISLPNDEHINYVKLTQKKHLKIGVERFVQCSIIMPAIIEAITLIRTELQEEDDEDKNVHYVGTVWAESIQNGLKKFGIDLEDSDKSSYELANLLLGNVISDSISNLYQKMTEWSNLRQEDDTL